MLNHQPTAWPEGVIARYLTVGGAHVDIQTVDVPAVTYTAVCTGCTTKRPFSSGDDRHGTHGEYAIRRVVDEARTWAQPHAETCRAMPKPGGDLE